MPCDRLQLLQHLAVDQIRMLEEDEWQEHFEMCEECQGEWDAYSRSLAIFRQLERECISQFASVPSWNEFSDKLAADWLRWNLIRKLRLPAAAAAVAAFTVVGVSAWLTGGGHGTEPHFAKERPAQVVPVRSESKLPKIPRYAPNQLKYVSSQPSQVSRPVNRTARRNETYVFELRRGEVKIGVVGIDGRTDAPSDGLFRFESTRRRPTTTQSLWDPPNSTRLPGQPAKVEFPVHSASAR